MIKPSARTHRNFRLPTEAVEAAKILAAHDRVSLTKIVEIALLRLLRLKGYLPKEKK